MARITGATRALILATLIAFFATWILHSYQWYWIRGDFPIIWQDVAFWSVMGLLVLANMIHESRHPKRARLTQKAPTFRDDLVLVLKTLGTFLTIVLSWAVWSTESYGLLRMVIGKLYPMTLVDASWMVGALLLFVAATLYYDRQERRDKAALLRNAPSPSFLGTPWPAWRTALSSTALVALAYGALLFYYPPAMANLVDGLRNPLRLSRYDEQMMDRGYYEDLTDVARFNDKLAKMYAQKPADWERCWAMHRSETFPYFELLPSRHVAFKGAMMSTNRWGMRDHEYTKDKPAGVYRIALSGASHAMGTGVEDDQSFENLVEARLNRDLTKGGSRKYEILNFSVGGYGPLARYWQFQSRMLQFHPDMLVLVSINDLHWLGKEVALQGIGRYELPFPEFVEAAKTAGIHKGMEYPVALAKIRPYREKLLLDLYKKFVTECSRAEITPVMVTIPRVRVEDADTQKTLKRQMEIAREAGYVVFDLLDTYADTKDIESLWLAPWDHHPNAAGHRVLADHLYPLLASQFAHRGSSE